MVACHFWQANEYPVIGLADKIDISEDTAVVSIMKCLNTSIIINEFTVNSPLTCSTICEFHRRG